MKKGKEGKRRKGNFWPFSVKLGKFMVILLFWGKYEISYRGGEKMIFNVKYLPLSMYQVPIIDILSILSAFSRLNIFLNYLFCELNSLRILDLCTFYNSISKRYKLNHLLCRWLPKSSIRAVLEENDLLAFSGSASVASKIIFLSPKLLNSEPVLGARVCD